MRAEGIYLFTAEAENASGNIHTGSVAVAVMKKESLDALLSARWYEMKDLLSVSEVDKAARYFVSRVREPFRELFAALPGDVLGQMARDIADIQLVRVGENIVEYDLRKVGDEKTYSYYLIFAKDEDGLWKIRAF